MFLLRCVAIRPSVAILPFHAAPHDTAVCGILSVARYRRLWPLPKLTSPPHSAVSMYSQNPGPFRLHGHTLIFQVTRNHTLNVARHPHVRPGFRPRRPTTLIPAPVQGRASLPIPPPQRRQCPMPHPSYPLRPAPQDGVSSCVCDDAVACWVGALDVGWVHWTSGKAQFTQAVLAQHARLGKNCVLGVFGVLAKTPKTPKTNV
ncbi:hypothetical protein B0H10DRAFT_2192878 [Mycena sp. CBHHK59/15]|nr:hypothetical protein B0H10DRAFT_2192878 [Mycena sp. CBHHK59/15]